MESGRPERPASSAPPTTRWLDAARVPRGHEHRRAVCACQSWLLRLGGLGSVNLIENGSPAAREELLRCLLTEVLRVSPIEGFAQQQLAVRAGDDRLQMYFAFPELSIRPDWH